MSINDKPEEHHDYMNPRTIKFDNTVPGWGIFMLFFAVVTALVSFSWSELREQRDRMTTMEINSVEARKKIDFLESQHRDAIALISRMGTDVQIVKELMLRLEKRLDNGK
jgi:hypothetical protein